MACTNQALANITRPCSNVGGIFTEVYVALRENLDTVTFVEQEEPKNTISSITLKNNAKWNVFQFGKNSSSFTSTAQYDGTTGAYAYTQNDLALSFNRMEASKRLSFMGLLQNEIVVVFRDSNGVNYLLGYDEYVSSSAFTFTTGTAKTDSNVVNVTLTDASAELPFIVTDEALETIKGNLVE